MMDPTHTFSPHSSLASEVVDGELVVLQLEDGIYYGLDTMGTAIWKELASGRPIGAILQQLLRQFPEEPRERISADLSTLTNELISSHLLVRSDSGR
jgi:hypothetical protein